MSAYITDTHERCVKGLTTSIVNLTPDFCQNERNAVKKQIEMRLYEIFRKYTYKI